MTDNPQRGAAQHEYPEAAVQTPRPERTPVAVAMGPQQLLSWGAILVIAGWLVFSVVLYRRGSPDVALVAAALVLLAERRMLPEILAGTTARVILGSVIGLSALVWFAEDVRALVNHFDVDAVWLLGALALWVGGAMAGYAAWRLRG